jgi:ferredoxin, 2Fe-2S
MAVILPERHVADIIWRRTSPLWSNGQSKPVEGVRAADRCRLYRAVQGRVPAERTQDVPKVVYVGGDGQERVVDATPGESVMATAVKNGVPGIVGECGGNASCATCHVWVREEFWPLLDPIGEMEEDLLDMGVSERRSTSRLSCQVEMSDGLDGLTVDIPSEQP